MSNPLIERYRFSLLRPKQVWIHGVIYLVSISILFITNNAAHGPNGSSIFAAMYYQFLVIQFLVLCGWAAYNSSAAIKDEILENTYDFFRILPLTAMGKATGILIGKNLIVLIIAGFNTLFLLAFGLAGRVPLRLQGQCLLLLVALALLLNPLALLSSTFGGKKRKANTTAIVVLIAFLVFPAMLGAARALSETTGLEGHTIGFFTLQIPILLFVSYVALYYCGWAFKGIVRRFTREQEPLLTNMGALLIMIGHIVICTGIVWPYANDGEGVVYALGFWLATFLPLLLIPFGCRKDFNAYLELYGLARQRGQGSVLSLLVHSNMSIWLLLFFVWGAAAVGVIALVGDSILRAAYLVFVAFSFHLFLLLLFELLSVYKAVFAKILLLLGFFVILYLFLPLLFAAIFENKDLVVYSLFGAYGYVFEHAGRTDTLILWDKPAVWIFNLVLCLVPALLVFKRYTTLIRTRAKM